MKLSELSFLKSFLLTIDGVHVFLFLLNVLDKCDSLCVKFRLCVVLVSCILCLIARLEIQKLISLDYGSKS